MALYNIQAAAQISGVSDACIRAWEKRYKSISPARSQSNHRLYSDADVERLKLFNKLILIGMKISQLSLLDNEELKKIYHSVTNQKMEDEQFHVSQAPSTLYQSLYIIEESFNAKRFDVAYHELKKVIAFNPPLEIALKFIPAIDGLCHNWRAKDIIDPNQVNAFERYLNSMVIQRVNKERHNLIDVSSISVSLESTNKRIADSGLEMLLAAHKIDNSLFSNEVSIDFLPTLIKVMSPRFVFLMAEHNHPEVERLIESFDSSSSTTLIIFDEKSTLLKSNFEVLSKAKIFNSVFEIDQFLERSIQF